MIRLASKNLPPEIQKTLADLQKDVNTQLGFNEKVDAAKQLWKTKGGAQNKHAFDKIKTELKSLCSFHGTCCYCEQNEATDIEHIYPKSFFPEYAFHWENYLLACGTCNTHFKLDRIHVLDEKNNISKVPRGTIPSSKKIAFINPRIENPFKFMILSFPSYKFELVPSQSKSDANKASSTIEILELNTRDVLIEARRRTARYYYERLERLSKIIEAKDVFALKELLNPIDDRFDLELPLAEIKQSITESFKQEIQTHQHPSVWESIKFIQSKFDSKWKSLFDKVPEALEW